MYTLSEVSTAGSSKHSWYVTLGSAAREWRPGVNRAGLGLAAP